jgi:hypothetical protein
MVITLFVTRYGQYSRVHNLSDNKATSVLVIWQNAEYCFRCFKFEIDNPVMNPF